MRHSRLFLMLSLLVVAVMVASSCTGPSTKLAPPDSPTTPSPTPTPTPTPPEQVSPSATKRPQEVNGSFDNINGIPVLRLWGSHEQMGYAYGYLCARQLADVIPQRLFANLARLPADMTYEKMVGLMNCYIQWPDWCLVEIKAALAGMQAVLGGSLPVVTHNRIESRNKIMDADMVALFHCLPQLIATSSHCSGFAAWGEKTADGQGRVGGNMDYNISALSSYLVVVRKPDYGLSTVCTNHIGFLLGGGTGTLRGMNEKGVALATTGCSWLTRTTPPDYPNVLGREVLEQVSAGPDMVSSIVKIFETHSKSSIGNFLFAQGKSTWTQPKADQMAVVIESDTGGATARLPSHNAQQGIPLQEAIVISGLFLQRQVPVGQQAWESNINKYNNMVKALSEQKIDSLTAMQKVLQAGVSPTNNPNPTILSIYFEPDTMKLHVAFFKQGGQPAPYLNPVSFTWDELFSSIPK